MIEGKFSQYNVLYIGVTRYSVTVRNLVIDVGVLILYIIYIIIYIIYRYIFEGRQ